MYNYTFHRQLDAALKKHSVKIKGRDHLFYARFLTDFPALHSLYFEIYARHPAGDTAFEQLLGCIAGAYKDRSKKLNQRDVSKFKKGSWFLSNKLAGMSLYVDRFSGNLKTLEEKHNYFKELGVNVLHLMPLFESPPGESDGGYAVSDFRKVDERFGTLDDLVKLQKRLYKEKMYLMVDIVLNHTSDRHMWAKKAREGDAGYQDFYYMYDDRMIPDEFGKSMPEIFPESAPGNFTWVEECRKWVMTVFHNYQWDLNYSNPAVFVAMLDTIFFYANLGVDILRIDAPAFIWKQPGTTCQNLPRAHTLLRLIRLCVQVATPGMALLGEAIVAPREIMEYFGTASYKAKECDLAYNATQMALQWDMLATGDTRVMLAAQSVLLQKPFGTSWITYTRCHDDIGLGYSDYMIEQAGFSPYHHRQFLKNFYSGNSEGSSAKGALFSYNPKTGDARISGTLASLCGLEKAITGNDEKEISLSIKKILLMQAHSFFIGGLPVIFYGDEAGYTNDYSYLNDEGKSYDNRWMHRPVINWSKNEKIHMPGSIEHSIFSGTQKLLAIRKKLPVVADHNNLTWLTPHNIHIAAFVRTGTAQKLFCVFNFSNRPEWLTWLAFKEKGAVAGEKLHDHWTEQNYYTGSDDEFLIIEPFGFCLLEVGTFKV